jgi:hypothetical protein
MQVVSSGNPNPVFKGRPTTAQLKDPATNLHWGCSILAHNIKAAGGDERRAIYNYSGGGAWPSFDTYVARYWNKVQTYRQALEGLASEESVVSNPIQVAFQTQVDSHPDSNLFDRDCLATGTAIVTSHATGQRVVTDDVVKVLGPAKKPEIGYFIADVIGGKIEKTYGARFASEGRISKRRLAQLIGEGKLVIALINHGLLPYGWQHLGQKGKTFGHFVVINGYADAKVYFLDPAWPTEQQGRCWLPEDQFFLAWGTPIKDVFAVPCQGLCVTSVRPQEEPEETKPLPPIQRPNFPLRGLHGDGAAEYALATGLKGTVVEVVYSHGDLNTPRPVDYSAYEAAGIRVIVRWNHSWATADGGLGTFPVRALYQAFRRWLYESIRQSKGVHLHIIGNETNRAAERPDYQDEQNPGTAITPADVLAVYNPVWKALPTGVRLSPPAIDPTNNQSGDPLQYQKEIIAGLAGAEGFALHGYSYRSDQAVNTDERFASMRWQVYGFRMWEAFAQAIHDYERDGQPIFRRLPLYITETNHLFRRDGNLGWDEDAARWIVEAGRYVAWWNAQPGEQFVHSLCFYRFRGDAWTLEHYPALLDAVRSVA